MIASLFALIVYLLALGILVAIVFYVVDNFIPEPVGKFVKVAAVVICGLIVVAILLQIAGGAQLSLPKL